MKFFLLFFDESYRVAHINEKLISQISLGGSPKVEVLDVTDYFSEGKILDKELFIMVHGNKRYTMLVKGLFEMKIDPIVTFRDDMGTCTRWLEPEEDEK